MTYYKPLKRLADGGDPYSAGMNYATGMGQEEPAWNPHLSKGLAGLATGIGKGVGSTTPSGSGPDWASIGSKAGTVANGVMPYLSNILNSFRRTPSPHRPILNNPITLSTVDYSNARNDVSRQLSTESREADVNLGGGQAATSVKLFNQGRKLEAISDINEKEQNTNAGIRNQQAGINSQIEQGNNSNLDDYNSLLLQRDIAKQRAQSENVANFSDKAVGIQNEKAKAQLDRENTAILFGLYQNSGVLDRMAPIWQKMGIADPTGRNYNWVNPDQQSPTKKMGGKMKCFGGRMKPVY